MNSTNAIIFFSICLLFTSMYILAQEYKGGLIEPFALKPTEQRYADNCTEHFALKGDTIDFDFYNRYPEDNIEAEWRSYPKGKNSRHKYYYVKVFRIKNNFSHDIYLERVQTGAGYCIPGCLYAGYIKPDSVYYSSLHFILDGKTNLRRPVGYFFTFCPNTPEAEGYMVQYHFEGTKK